MVHKKNPVVYLRDRAAAVSAREQLRLLLAALGGIDDLIKPGARVLIKPNFVAPFEKAVTNLDMVAGVIEEVQRRGGVPIVGESAGFEFDTAATFTITGLNALCGRYGITAVNFDTQEFVKLPTGDALVKELKVPRIVAESDCIINMPKLKGHALTKVTFGMKNLFGMLHRDTRRQLHSFGLERGIALVNRVIRPQLTIVDGLWVLRKAVYGGESYEGVMIAGRDICLVDYACCVAYGMDYRRVPHIRNMLTPDLLASLELVPVTGSQPLPGVTIPLPWRRRFGYLKQCLGYQAMYLTDWLLTKIGRRSSIIPSLHLHLGVKPVIVSAKCTMCGDCRAICPVQAIGDDMRIDYDKCKYVRCLKCRDICPAAAVKIGGFHTF